MKTLGQITFGLDYVKVVRVKNLHLSKLAKYMEKYVTVLMQYTVVI